MAVDAGRARRATVLEPPGRRRCASVHMSLSRGALPDLALPHAHR